MCPSRVFLKLIPCILPKLTFYLLTWVLMSPPCCSHVLHCFSLFILSSLSKVNTLLIYIIRPNGSSPAIVLFA
jgi:hypothetical protein